MSDQVSLCDSIEPFLGDYADGEVVSAAEKARIESHLKVCPRCMSEIAFLRATNFVVSTRYPDVQPPVDVFVRTALATYKRPTLRARIAGWFAPLPVRVSVGSAVATAVVVAVVVPISRSQQVRPNVSPIAANDSPYARSNRASKKSVHSAPTKDSFAALVPKISAEQPSLAAVTAKSAPVSAVSESLQSHAKEATGKPLVRPEARVAKVNTAVVVPGHGLPAVINRVKLAPLVIPAMRETELSRRGGDFQRTLPNGDLPKEFAAPKVGGVPIEEPPAPARIATLTSPSIAEVGTSSAHSVVEPPPVPKGPHISLGGAGGRVAFAPIQGIKSHDPSDDSWLPGQVNAPTN